MIAADTSSLFAYFTGDDAADVDRLASALAAAELVMPPVVVTELLSGGANVDAIDDLIRAIGILDPTEGFWERAGRSRRLLLRYRFKAKVADTLIAQSCIDHDVPLITRDSDFRHFARHCGLKLA